MEIVNTINEVRQKVAQARSAGKRITFVPTMGALHAGHVSLIDEARASADKCVDGGFVVVSIFVNPTQFGPGEDLASYPRTLEADSKLCDEHRVDLIFAPSAEEMYSRKLGPFGGDGSAGLTTVSVAKLTETLCGRTRPTHFAGVCTVVAKLFNIVLPNEAFFGAKDFQQATVIRRMAYDLNIPVDIRVCPIVRESDGLAMSSRNAYLSAEHRNQAVALHGALKMAAKLIDAGQPQATTVINEIKKYISENAPAGEIDYVQIVDPDTLEDVQTTDKPVQILVAVKFAGARLIDNMRAGNK